MPLRGNSCQNGSFIRDSGFFSTELEMLEDKRLQNKMKIIVNLLEGRILLSYIK